MHKRLPLAGLLSKGLSMTGELAEAVLRQILDCLPQLQIAVVGDLFLDRYLDLDYSLTEPSLETGLAAFQVTKIRASPAAAGTVLNNLVALGVGKVSILSVIGGDAEGFELRRELDRLEADSSYLISDAARVTPTYVKPMLHEPGRTPRELSRFDLRNRTPLPKPLSNQVLQSLACLMDEAHALV